jgi:hypothetical protein
MTSALPGILIGAIMGLLVLGVAISAARARLS